eukprot:TRINITY_DN3768_c0_g2_i7.p1 TRINITY_DN3768_c0_g2~~TRINITY_DN3768_c0_g2_i7.p1  ORF type:complete len:134 (+),score=13.86 TRINITY_DN3768_c0_g2_i7:287-688(+)
MIEISKCENDYKENRCEPGNRVPAIESYCVELEKCMNKNPHHAQGSSRITSALLADILNGFVENLSIKTIIVILSLFFGTILVCNCALGSYREYRHSPRIPPPAPPIMHRQSSVKKVRYQPIDTDSNLSLIHI